MEDLVNPLMTDLKGTYSIFFDEPICCVAGIWFVEREDKRFDIKGNISKLDKIINNLIDKINGISYENKSYLIETLKEKKGKLVEILGAYKKIEEDYTEFDKFYRENLFEFYANKYNDCDFFSFNEQKKYLSIMNDIQMIIKKKFDAFLKDYYELRNSFFDINSYIIKAKKLFPVQE